MLLDLAETIMDGNACGLLLPRDILDLVLIDLLGDYVAVVDGDLFVDYVGGRSQHQLRLVGCLGEGEQQDGGEKQLLQHGLIDILLLFGSQGRRTLK